MSIKIDNMFLTLGDYVFSDSPVKFNVDVVDDVYNITTSGTYFVYNGSKIPTYYTTITSGYNIYFYTVPSGNIYLDVHASNDNGDTLTKSYEFRYGYHVSWDEVVYWGPEKQVHISIVLNNNAIAPNTTYFSTLYVTHPYHKSDLYSEFSIEGSGYADFGIYIKPQSKALFYGKTYTITISGVKDYSGNVMKPFVYKFTTENES